MKQASTQVNWTQDKTTGGQIGDVQHTSIEQTNQKSVNNRSRTYVGVKYSQEAKYVRNKQLQLKCHQTHTPTC